MGKPVSVWFDDDLLAALATYQRQHPGASPAKWIKSLLARIRQLEIDVTALHTARRERRTPSAGGPTFGEGMKRRRLQLELEGLEDDIARLRDEKAAWEAQVAALDPLEVLESIAVQLESARRLGVSPDVDRLMDPMRRWMLQIVETTGWAMAAARYQQDRDA